MACRCAEGWPRGPRASGPPTLKRKWVDHDGGYHVWSNTNQSRVEHLDATAPDILERDSVKRAKTVQEKQLHWKDAITAAEGQQTVLLAELSMAEYHLNELQTITNTAATQVKENKAALEECRAHVAKMHEAVNWLFVLGQEAGGLHHTLEGGRG